MTGGHSTVAPSHSLGVGPPGKPWLILQMQLSMEQPYLAAHCGENTHSAGRGWQRHAQQRQTCRSGVASLGKEDRTGKGTTLLPSWLPMADSLTPCLAATTSNGMEGFKEARLEMLQVFLDTAYWNCFSFLIFSLREEVTADMISGHSVPSQ